MNSLRTPGEPERQSAFAEAARAKNGLCLLSRKRQASASGRTSAVSDSEHRTRAHGSGRFGELAAVLGDEAAELRDQLEALS